MLVRNYAQIDLPPNREIIAPAAAPQNVRSGHRLVSSFALATSCVTRLCSFTLRLTMPHGALASLRGRPEPPHDGIRRMGRYNLSGALAAGQRQDRRTLRTHPTRRPREDIFPPEQNALSPRLQFHGVLRRRFRQP